MSGLWARLKAVDALVVDSLFAVAVLIPTFAGMTAEPPANNPTPVDALAIGLTLVGVGAIAVRRRHPLGALVVCIVATAVYTLRDYIENGLAIALLITLYTAATLIPRRQWLLAYGTVAAFLVMMVFVRPDDLTASQLVGNLALFGIAAVFGDSNATRRANTRALELRAEALERHQAIEAQQAVAEERLRIARQLHDVVAHALAVIAVQSGVGGHVIDSDPAEAKRVLDNINETSRETLDEMRRMLGVLRGQDGSRAELAPAPGLGDVEQLAKTIRDAATGPVVISAKTVIVSAVVGVTVTVVSAIAPALRAGRVRPIAALRDVAQDTTGSSVRRAAIGLVVAGAGVAAFAAGLVAESAQDAMALIGLGAVGVIVGVFVLGPVIARPAVHVLAAPASTLDGTTGRLARENAKRNPKRTAATASALMIGVALVGFITILAASTKDSVSAAVDRSLRADYVLDSGSWGDGGFSPELGDTVAALPEVGAVSPMRSTPAQAGSEPIQVLAFDTSTLDEVLDLDVTAGRLDEVTDGGIAVKADTEVRGRTLAVGDQVRVRFSRTGVVPLTVEAVFAENVPGVDGSYVVGLNTFEANVTDQFDRQIYVAAADGVDADASLAALEAVLEDWPNAELQDQAAFKADITGEIDRMLNLIYGLLALAVVIALIGIANTLALSVHERRREIGLLRAVGMSRRQVRRSVRWESVAIALLGTALGTVLAVAGAWGVIQALGNEVTAFTVPPTQVGVIVTLAALAGVGAALGPARRAAKLDVLDAIASP